MTNNVKYFMNINIINRLNTDKRMVRAELKLFPPRNFRPKEVTKKTEKNTIGLNQSLLTQRHKSSKIKEEQRVIQLLNAYHYHYLLNSSIKENKDFKRHTKWNSKAQLGNKRKYKKRRQYRLVTIGKPTEQTRKNKYSFPF